MCSPEAVIRGWGEDARDYFYLLRYDDLRHPETIIGYDLHVADFTSAELADMKVPEQWDRFALGLVSPAMGDQKSMEIAQLCHQNIMLRSGGMTESSWLSYQWPFPPSSIVAGCYCDDLDSVDSVMHEARNRIGHVHEGYETSGLIRKKAKAQSEVSVMTMGCHNDSCAKTVSSDELNALLGHWTHLCLFRRLCLCLLDEAYAWVRRDPTGRKRRRLGTKVRDEFLGLLLLWRLIQSDMQVVPSPRTYASDATVKRGAVVESQLLRDRAVFFWSRRKQKIEQ
eukprot:4099831-Amphidinium_carterae.4